MGAKCVILIKNNNLLCMNAFTYAMRLIMDKTWKKSFSHFGGL